MELQKRLEWDLETCFPISHVCRFSETTHKHNSRANSVFCNNSHLQQLDRQHTYDKENNYKWLMRVCMCTQELQLSAQSLQEEREEVKRRMEESTARLLQLEEDLIGVTQKGLQKETELDWCFFFFFLTILK